MISIRTLYGTLFRQRTRKVRDEESVVKTICLVSPPPPPPSKDTDRGAYRAIRCFSIGLLLPIPNLKGVCACWDRQNSHGNASCPSCSHTCRSDTISLLHSWCRPPKGSVSFGTPATRQRCLCTTGSYKCWLHPGSAWTLPQM